jgi:hypothetical protein
LLAWVACDGDVDAGGGTTTTTTDTGATGGAAGASTPSGGGSGGAAGAGAHGGGVAGGPIGGGGNGGAGGSASVKCNPTGVVCATPPPGCDPGEVPSIEGACWGPCVPILSCATEDSCANCQGAFCAEYVAWKKEYRCVLPTLQCSATTCGCLAPYFCVAPFDACSEGSMGGPVVSCGCPAC